MTQHVLIVDDDPAECEILQRTLHNADIQAVILTDSRQAMTILSNHTFDAIFVDFKMPPPDGMELTRLIRASQYNQKTPVIMITGHADTSIVSQGFQAGITFFLYKPLPKDGLLNLVRLTKSVNRVERCRFHRVEIQQRIKVQFKGETAEGSTIDISLNGVLVRASRTFAPGAQVKVIMDLSPTAKPLVINGVLARVVDGNCMGIHFTAIGIAESKQLQSFLLPLMTGPHPVSQK